MAYGSQLILMALLVFCSTRSRLPKGSGEQQRVPGKYYTGRLIFSEDRMSNKDQCPLIQNHMVMLSLLRVTFNTPFSFQPSYKTTSSSQFNNMQLEVSAIGSATKKYMVSYLIVMRYVISQTLLQLETGMVNMSNINPLYLHIASSNFTNNTEFIYFLIGFSDSSSTQLVKYRQLTDSSKSHTLTLILEDDKTSKWILLNYILIDRGFEYCATGFIQSRKLISTQDRKQNIQIIIPNYRTLYVFIGISAILCSDCSMSYMDKQQAWDLMPFAKMAYSLISIDMNCNDKVLSLPNKTILINRQPRKNITVIHSSRLYFTLLLLLLIY